MPNNNLTAPLMLPNDPNFDPRSCAADGTQEGIECECDECDYYRLCCPDTGEYRRAANAE